LLKKSLFIYNLIFIYLQVVKENRLPQDLIQRQEGEEDQIQNQPIVQERKQKD